MDTLKKDDMRYLRLVLRDMKRTLEEQKAKTEPGFHGQIAFEVEWDEFLDWIGILESICYPEANV